MSTSALYTFKDGTNPEREKIHLVYHSDGYPRGAADLIPELAQVAKKIWSGNEPDLRKLKLPNIDQVELRKSVEESAAIHPAAFRYEIEMEGDHLSVITAHRHNAEIPKELLEKFNQAKEALKQVEQEMYEAQRAPTYLKIGEGNLLTIRALGFGYPDIDD
jgi:hypothetical protein